MTDNNLETAVFGAGCFWGVEDTFMKVPGVKETEVGYTGGTLDNPSYEDVCTNKTGHAEVVKVQFYPAEISYKELLNIFWNAHNPTTLNRQGPDVGSQYRSAIFTNSTQQEAVAKKSMEEMEASGEFKDPIVTEITPSSHFHRAEEYHQKYHQKQGGECAV